MKKIILSNDIKNPFRVKWERHAARSGVTFIFSYVHLSGYINIYPKLINDRFWYVVAVSSGPNWLMWRNEEDVERLRKNLARKIGNISYARNIYEKIVKHTEQYRRFGDKLKNINYQKLSNKKLANVFTDYIWNTPNGSGAASVVIELASAFSLGLKKELCIKDKRKIESTMLLISSPSKIALPLEEEMNFLKLVLKIGLINIDNLPENKLRLIKRHFNIYRFLSVYFDNEPWSWQEFLARIKDEQRQGKTKNKLQELEKNYKDTEKKVRWAIKKYNLNWVKVDLLRKMMYYRIQSENYYSYVNYCALELKKEVARRLYLSLDQLRYLLPEEVNQSLLKKKLNLEKRIAERKRGNIMIIGKKKIHIMVGEKAKKFLAQLPKVKVKEEKTRGIKGIGAQQGKVRGIVKVVRKIKELAKVKNKDILVTQNTTPIFVPAIKLAAAIVTDEGGITCHAAIVARELKKPCVIGTKIATKVLKDGDKVVVDANRGEVRRF